MARKPGPFVRTLAALILLAQAGVAAAQAPAAPAATSVATQPIQQPVQAPPPAAAGNTVTATPVPAPAPPQPGTTPPPPAPAPPEKRLEPPPTWFVFVTLGFLLLAVLIGVASVRSALAREGRWSIADALSEEAVVVVLDASGAPVLGADQKAVTAPRLVASSSRFIAFIGLFAILALYAGFGAGVLYFFITGQGTPPGMDEVRNFLLAGLTLFAPYIVNKFASIFSSSGQTTK